MCSPKLAAALAAVELGSSPIDALHDLRRCSLLTEPRRVGEEGAGAWPCVGTCPTDLLREHVPADAAASRSSGEI